MRLSIVDVAERLKVEPEIARGFVKLLVGYGLAKPVGERPSRTGRGRSEAVFLFEEGYEQGLAHELLKAGLV